MAGQKIRIKLAAYDHKMVDQATEKIVETMKKAGAKISGPIPSSHRERGSNYSSFAPQVQGQQRTVRDQNS